MSDDTPARPRVRGSRRAQRPAPAGVDLTPAAHPLTTRATEDTPEGWGETPPRNAGGAGENDERLQSDKPPHWG